LLQEGDKVSVGAVEEVQVSQGVAPSPATLGVRRTDVEVRP
jgi:hypothetical protein